MKRLIICAVMLSITTSIYCQKTSLTRDDYLRKSKHAKTTGWILLGAGVATITYGIIAGLSNNDDQAFYYGVLIGVPLTIASVPFLNAAVRHKQKANSLSADIELERYNNPGDMKNKNSFVPALAMRLNF
jgi:NO-binding membrane sensor protein with MHYT domain